MKARLPLGIAGVVVAVGFAVAGFTAARSLVGSVAFLRDLAANPFRLTTRVAPAGPAVLEAVQALERLETCRYRGQAIVRGDTQGILPNWLAGDRMVFIGHGEVVAGVDLSRLSQRDLQVREDRVEIRLPEPELFHTRLDSQRSEVFDRQAGLLTGPDPDLESRVRQQAEAQIQAAAMESGVLNKADANARQALEKHLRLLGFRSVRFL